MLFTEAVTAVAVGEDCRRDRCRRGDPAVIDRIDEPACAALSSSRSRGAFRSSMTSTERSRPRRPRMRDSRSTSDAFVAFAALTVGMLETALGRDDTARASPARGRRAGTRFGNRWLTSSARTQLAILDVRAGELDRRATTSAPAWMRSATTKWGRSPPASCSPRSPSSPWPRRSPATRPRARLPSKGCASAPVCSPGRSPAGSEAELAGSGHRAPRAPDARRTHTSSVPSCARTTRSRSSGPASADPRRLRQRDAG